MSHFEKTVYPQISSIRNYLEKESSSDIRNQILSGLTANPRYISSRYFYDDRGSELFEQITRLPEYYPGRTEKGILEKKGSEIMRNFGGDQVIELGSGDCSKISLLFDALPAKRFEGLQYHPVDVSRAAVEQSSSILREKYPGLQIHGMLTDFLKHVKFYPTRSARLVCFFGSTLGNFRREVAGQFLLNVASMMDPGDRFLLGLDMVKDREVLEAAYNDSRGVTAAFNRNILSAVNQLVGTSFDPGSFRHVAFYNEAEKRVEMHLEAICDMEVALPDHENPLFIRTGERIHTENSHKYASTDIMEMATLTGLTIDEIFTDENEWFSLVYFRKD